jgi:hypothetical protein
MRIYLVEREREALGVEAARGVRHRGELVVGAALQRGRHVRGHHPHHALPLLASRGSRTRGLPGGDFDRPLGRGAALREQRPDDAGRGLPVLPDFPSLGSAPLSVHRKV